MLTDFAEERRMLTDFAEERRILTVFAEERQMLTDFAEERRMVNDGVQRKWKEPRLQDFCQAGRIHRGAEEPRTSVKNYGD